MKTFFVVSIAVFLLNHHPCSWAEGGGRTGNGGGVIECLGKPPLVHDYFDAVESGDEILNFDGWSRKKFFNEMERRVGKIPTARYHSVEMQKGLAKTLLLTSETLKSRVESIGASQSWKATEPWRTLDEVTGDLPSGCHFVQAAINRDGVPYQIKNVVDSLSESQRWVLELHEAISSSFFDRNSLKPQLTSRLIRKIVVMLLKKNFKKKLADLPLNQLSLPNQVFNLDKDGTVLSYYSWQFYPLSKMSGTAFLSMTPRMELSEKLSLAKQCPLMLAASPTGDGGLSLVGLMLKGGVPRLLEEYIPPKNERTPRGEIEINWVNEREFKFKHIVDGSISIYWKIRYSGEGGVAEGQSLEIENLLEAEVRCNYYGIYDGKRSNFQDVREGEIFIEKVLNHVSLDSELTLFRPYLSWPTTLLELIWPTPPLQMINR